MSYKGDLIENESESESEIPMGSYYLNPLEVQLDAIENILRLKESSQMWLDVIENEIVSEWEYSYNWYWKCECKWDDLQQGASQIEDKVDEIEFFYMLLVFYEDKKITKEREFYWDHTLIFKDKKRWDTKFVRENQHQPFYTSGTKTQDLERMIKGIEEFWWWYRWNERERNIFSEDSRTPCYPDKSSWFFLIEFIW